MNGVKVFQNDEKCYSFKGWMLPKLNPKNKLKIGPISIPVIRYINLEGSILVLVFYILMGGPMYFFVYDIFICRYHEIYFPGVPHCNFWLESYSFCTCLWLFSNIMLFYTHFVSMTTDAGNVTTYLDECMLTTPPKLYLPFCAHYCYKCEDMYNRRHWKPPRAYHCRSCQSCIFGMDHHCPWINNCVGYFNMRYFVQFLQWLFLHSIVTFVFLMNLLFRTNFMVRNLDNFQTNAWKTILELMLFNRCGFSFVCCFLGAWSAVTFYSEISDYMVFDQTVVETWKEVRGSGYIHPLKGYLNYWGRPPLSVDDEAETDNAKRLYGPIRNESIPALIDSDEGFLWEQWILNRSFKQPDKRKPSLRVVYSGLIGDNLITVLFPTREPLFTNFADTPWNLHSGKGPTCYSKGCQGGSTSYAREHKGITLHPCSWQGEHETDTRSAYRRNLDSETIEYNMQLGNFDFKDFDLDQVEDSSQDGDLPTEDKKTRLPPSGNFVHVN